MCETLKQRVSESDSELKYATTQMPTIDQNSNNVPNTVGPSCCVAGAQTETKLIGNQSLDGAQTEIQKPEHRAQKMPREAERERRREMKSEATSECVRRRGLAGAA